MRAFFSVWSVMRLVLLLFASCAVAALLPYTQFKAIYSINLATGRLPSMVATRADYDALVAAELADVPVCPNRANNTFFRCNDAARLTYLRIESPVREQLNQPIASVVAELALTFEPELSEIEIFHFAGRVHLQLLVNLTALRRLDIRDSFVVEHLTGLETYAMNFFRARDELHVYNTTILGVPFTSAPSQMPRVCNFTRLPDPRVAARLLQWLCSHVRDRHSALLR